MANETPTIESSLFNDFLDKYERMIDGEPGGSFSVPDILKDICKIYFFHNLNKLVNYKNIPESTIFIDDVDECLKWLNPKVEKETRGLFKKLDDLTEKNMRRCSFRSAIVAFFYLEGIWDGTLDMQDVFYNKDKPPKTDVLSVSFSGVKVVVENGALTSYVDYENKDLGERGLVRFEMSDVKNVPDGVYEQCRLVVPKVDIHYRRIQREGFDTIVMNFRYAHDDIGFKAAGVYSKDTCDGGCFVTRKFVLDRPFKITIFYKNQEMLNVLVNNI